MNKLQLSADKFTVQFIDRLPNFFLAVFLLLAGIWLIKRFVRFLHRRFHKNSIDISLSEFLISIINVVLYVVLVIACASMIGIPTSSFVAVVGAAGLAVGLALQGSLSNFAGGVLILLFKPFRVGHNISSSNNVSGLVLKIDILYTTLKAGNGTTIYAPNGPLANAVINNVSDNETRQAEYKLNVAYDTNIDHARKAILAILENDELVLKDPKPAVLVGSLGETGIVLIVRAWIDNTNFWPVYYSNYQKLIEVLDRSDIKLPNTTPQITLLNQPSQ
ncbi:small conductance mechanosensitive channel [Pedobacter westerhofensis]|uniref:Small conductance mechanosensitive channel n=1 Tax=Pedobacter westerhofensis TaxID=425512 RepID=A0A521FCC0_9SPHI|nr:mechanosensitive ion channel family protein [Pedobacter westerhofensis]SMO93805.1 small conductance mechanosensitive channel [Pedobacter westerhofensis]